MRDAVGDTVTRVYSVEGALVDSDGWSWGLTALKGIDKRAQLLVYTDGLDMAAVDRYAYTRDVFMNMRATQVGGTPPSAEYDDTNIDDLVPADADSNAPEDTATPASDDTSSLNDATLLPSDDVNLELSALDAEQTAVNDIATAHVDATELPIATATELAPAQYADDLALLH